MQGERAAMSAMYDIILMGNGVCVICIGVVGCVND